MVGRCAAACAEIGNIVCTCLFKHDVFPIIRFNTQDVTRELSGANPDGLPFRRIAGFLGRSDNMVKLCGINVYPTAIGDILKAAWPDFAGEYVCELTRSGAREDITVLIEAPKTAPAEIKVADSWGDAAWGCPAHVEEALINVRSVFIASEELGGLASYVHR